MKGKTVYNWFNSVSYLELSKFEFWVSNKLENLDCWKWCLNWMNFQCSETFPNDNFMPKIMWDCDAGEEIKYP